MTIQSLKVKNYYLLIAAGLVFLQSIVLYLMDRVVICKCGFIKFWHGIPVSSENSQHLTDWYTFSHIIHGFIFYFVAKTVFKKLHTWQLLVISIIPEVVWEIIENTPLIINRYRESTISLDYYGDSIVNSTFDTIAMIIGFLIAYKLPVYVTIIIAIFLELLALYFIRDNLTLNVIMLIMPLQAIRNWQAGT